MATNTQTDPKIAEFRELLSKARSILVLTGAGISAESGVPTFRGEGGLWRQFNATDLATPSAFARSTSLVWEFYHYRRELVRTKEPNKGHLALVEAEERFEKEGKHFFILTQNIDGLHRRAGSRNLLEIHGNLFTVRCTSCGFIEENNDSPICEALRNRGLPNETGSDIPLKDLPSCRQCGSLVRPHVVWFEECLWPDVLKKINEEITQCDLFLVVGTSGIVYPAAGYASIVAQRKVPVVEVNIEKTPATSTSTFYFEGPAGELLPMLLAPIKTDAPSNKTLPLNAKTRK
ncbi:unnamed protein product [Rotaria socialis]|uniref:NAD-dependent protein deacylase n=1 Tax=Rotaria socialis TaxID=392032 RepID=A0A820EXW8_9BILA|nr:unnamed protein product [Rotaria socialis]CAF4557310.1 unnamed protein product [Rotaria socialis]